MKLNQIVTSPNASRNLYDIGLRRKCIYGWLYHAVTKKYVIKDFGLGKNLLRAYTLSELGEIIPHGNFNHDPVMKISTGEWLLKSDPHASKWETEVDARAGYLYMLIKTGQLKIEDLNK